MLFRQSDAPEIISDFSTHSIKVYLPNSAVINSLRRGLIHFPPLPNPILVHIFADEDLSTSLFSVSALCNQGCIATFSDNSFTITYNTTVLFAGTKLLTDTLWHVPLSTSQFSTISSTMPQVHAAFSLSADKDFVKFVHASIGSPALSTFSTAVRKGYLSSWPRLTSSLINAHPPNTLATAQGHLYQRRQGLDSTSVLEPSPDRSTSDIDLPLSPSSIDEVNRVYIRRVTLPHGTVSDHIRYRCTICFNIRDGRLHPR